MPFDDDDDNNNSNKGKGLKLDNKKSMFSSMPKKPKPEEFQKRIQEAHEKTSNYELEAAELTAMFQKRLEDKTLPVNRNIMSQEAERDLIGRIVDVAVKLNNDENEMEGMGSVGISLLLLHAVLFQRDKINNLEYNLVQADKKIKSLEEKLDLSKVDFKTKNE